MSTTALVQSTAPSISAETSSDPHAQGEAIAQLAAQLHAATYELLVLLRQFDECAGWNTGFLTCAHWLHSTPTRRLRASGTTAWRTGFDLGACREKVRVAKALASLPRISAEMRLGRLSYAKVRALTRVATQDTESTLVDLARAGNAAHVERFVRAWRRVNRAAAAAQTETRHLNRQLATWVDDDGMVVIRGRLAPDVGAVVQRALEAAADRLFHEQRDLPKPEQLVEEVTPAQRRADALGLLAEVALTADLDRGSAGDRYQVVLHAEMPTGVAAGDGLSGAVEVDHGAVSVSAETLRRVSCDAAVLTMRHDADGAVLDIGRNTRTVPPSIRRALQSRDRTCRFPGCTARRCDAHHVEHWVDGGATSVDHLVLLCRRHHRAVHEGGFGLIRHHDGRVTFLRLNGTVLDAVPALPMASGRLDVVADAEDLPTWDGARFDVAWAIDVLYRPVEFHIAPRV